MGRKKKITAIDTRRTFKTKEQKTVFVSYAIQENGELQRRTVEISGGNSLTLAVARDIVAQKFKPAFILRSEYVKSVQISGEYV